jgi:hypothetical protein
MPGLPLRPFVADHDHVARCVAAVLHRGLRFLFRFEHARRAAVHQRLQAGGLQQRAVGAQVALEHGQAAVARDRVFDPLDDRAVGRPAPSSSCASVRPV